MTRLRVLPAAGPLKGSVPLPSDKSIGHRALILASLSRGRCELTGFSAGADNRSTLTAFRQLGVAIEEPDPGSVIVHGVGLQGLAAPAEPIDCGNSGTTMRLLTGVLGAQPFATRLVGDASLSRRPMMRIAKPLRARGAKIEGRPHPKADDITAPLEVAGIANGQRLTELSYASPISSAQVKSAVLLSGLFAGGPTHFSEPLVSRDHTERMLDALGVPIDTVGPMIALHPPARANALSEFSMRIPGDVSAAAFPLAAALIVEGSHVSTRHTLLNPTRTGVLDIMSSMGGEVRNRPDGQVLGEGFGEVSAQFGGLSAASIGGELALRAIDEIPIACALAARANGETRFSDIGELRVKESDRIAAMVDTLTAFGVEAAATSDGLTVVGVPDAPLRAARIDSCGDHRIAMTAAVLALVADGPTEIDDVDCIATSFPRFVGTMRALGAEVEVQA